MDNIQYNIDRENRKLNLKNDVIFKAFFGKKGNEKYLIDFLTGLLKINIKEIEIKENRIEPLPYLDKKKLSEEQIPFSKVLKAIGRNPLFGDKRGKTRWTVFKKASEENG